MSSTILQSHFTEHYKKLHEDYKKIFKMLSDVSASKKPLKLEINAEEQPLNKRKLTSMMNALHSSSSPVNKLFKLANKGMSLRYAPTFLSTHTVEFLKDANKIISKDVMNKLTLFKKYNLIEQRSLDVLWNIYVNKQELYKNATQNIQRRKEDKKESKQYIAPDTRIKKFLKIPLQNLVNSFKGKNYTSDDINFKGKETVENLIDFKFFHFSRVKKAMVVPKTDLNKQQHLLIDKPKDNKIFKEYEKLVYKAKIDADLKSEELSESVFIDAAVTVSQMDLSGKNDEGVRKIGPYTQDQLKNLDVDKKNGSIQLAVRALLDTEILVLKNIKAKM